MLTRPLNRAYQTPVFEILAGPTEEVFYVHAGILAKSKVLQLQVAGWSLETQERKIRWPQWSADIVEKFLEWLYTGDYTIPIPTEARSVGKPQQVEEESSEPEDEQETTDQAMDEDFPVELQEEWSMPVQPEQHHLPPHMRTTKPLASSPAPSATPTAEGPLTALEDLTWKGSHALETTTRAEDFARLMDSQLAWSKPLDYNPTFTTHATLYIIACEKDLPELKNMSWQRLRSLLIDIGSPVLGTPLIANLVALITCTYRETGVSELTVDPLRDLLTSYAAINFTLFQGAEVDALFASQAADDREFLVELMAKVRQSMQNLEVEKYRTPKTTPNHKHNKVLCTRCGNQMAWVHNASVPNWYCRQCGK